MLCGRCLPAIIQGMDGHSKRRRGNELMPRYSSKSWRAFRVPNGPAAVTLEARDCRVLGLDPGSQRTGFGIIDCRAGLERYVTSGCIDVAGQDMVVRLQ